MTTTRWAILRTSGARTLALARSLNKADYEAWTPSAEQKRRQPRSQITRVVEVPIVPSFVFVRSDRLQDILTTIAAPSHSHPQFSVFRHGGKIPLVTDRDIEALRQMEGRYRKQAARSKRRAYVMGQRVRIVEGMLSGMTGIVEEPGRDPVINLGAGWRMKIATWLLMPDGVDNPPAQMGTAA